jgi:hypothetical protein
MKISATYAALTLPQRLRAMVSAFGRSDGDELDRLADTSRDGNHSVQKVKHHFRGLAHLAGLHNSLLLEPLAVWLFGQTFSPEDLRSMDAGECQAIEISRAKSLEEAASVEAAITGRIADAGISASDWQSFRERLLDKGAIFLLAAFLHKAAGHENPALAAQYREVVENYVFKADE